MEYLVQMVKSADTLYADKVSAHKQLSADFTYTPCGEIGDSCRYLWVSVRCCWLPDC